MIITDELVTDRSLADDIEARRINRKDLADMTEDEIAFLNTGKGGYHASDMNRVGRACAELYDALTATGNNVEYYGYQPLPTNWASGAEPSKNDLIRYIGTVRSLRGVVVENYGAPVPYTMKNLTLEGANNIEKMLLAVEGQIENMKAVYVQSGVRQDPYPIQSNNVFYIADYEQIKPVLPEVVPPQTVTVPSSGSIIDIPDDTYFNTWGYGWRELMRKTLKITINGEEWFLPPCYTNANWTYMDAGGQAWGEFYNNPLFTFYPAFVYATDMETMKVVFLNNGEITYSIDEVEYDDRTNYKSVARNQVVFTNASSPHTAKLKFSWVDSYGGGGWAKPTDTLKVTVNGAYTMILPPCPSPYTYGYNAWGACNNYVGGSLPPDFATIPICIYEDSEDNIVIETEGQETMTVLVEVQEE